MTSNLSDRVIDLLGGLAHKHEALGVGDDLGGVERLLKVIDELLLVAFELLLLRPADDLARADTLCLDGRQAAGKNGLTN